MQEGASEAESLNGAGGERAYLTIEGFGEFETRRKLSDALVDRAGGELIEPAKEEQVFAASEASVKTEVAAGVIAEIAADITRGLDDVVASDTSAAESRKEEGGEDTKESGLAGAVGTEKRNGFAFPNRKGNIL